MSSSINRPLISILFSSKLRSNIINNEHRMRLILTISTKFNPKKSVKGISKLMKFGLNWSYMKSTTLITMIS